MSTVTFDRDASPSMESGDTREPSVLPGGTLGRYELLRLLGRGGMGDVWLARQSGEYGFRRLVAMKTIRPEHAGNPAFRAMFLHEAHVAASIRHTNVVEVLDLAEENGVIYQVMPLVEGAALSALIEAAPEGLDVDVVARIGTHVARGLHAVHTAEDDWGRPLHLVHRDVSPHNVLVGFDGFAKIADFGIACTLAGSRGAFAAGKPEYMAPESLADTAGTVDVDPRVDVYALGVVMRRALGTTAIPAALDRALRRATAQSRSRRFGSAAELGDAIEDAVVLASAKSLGEVVRALCPPSWSRAAHHAA